ncbi:MAG TPA: hypothetical protein VGJ69_14455 [Pyrinomonadaceae bacterium]|jgi:hypothetical protein|nr:hypothetical protein [Pyrinomonadaceae bacterium]
MLFLLPGVLSIVLLAFLWRSGFVSHPLLIAGWCVLGIGLQVIGDFGSPIWLVGLLMNVGAAIYMIIRLKLG